MSKSKNYKLKAFKKYKAKSILKQLTLQKKAKLS